MIWDSALGALERWRPWGFGVGATWIFTIAHKSPIKEKKAKMYFVQNTEYRKEEKSKKKQKQKKKKQKAGEGEI